MSQRRRSLRNRHKASASRHRACRLELLEDRRVFSISPTGGSILLNSYMMGLQETTASQHAVAFSNDQMVVTYTGQGPRDRSGIYVTMLNDTGTVAVAPKQVNTTVRGVQSEPAVAQLADGSLLIAWAGRGAGDKQGIFVQRVSATGELLGTENLVNQTTGGDQIDPAIAVANDGSFVVVWSGVGTGDASGVFLRRFTAMGVAMGGEVRVNSTTANEQSAPAVAFDAAGNLLVAWQSRHQDGSDWGIYGQWYTAAGAALGTETRLNTTTAGSQSAPALATDPTGGILAAWQSHGQDGSGWGIVGRRFGNGGAAPTAERILNDPTTGNQTEVAIAVAEDGQWLVTWTSDRAAGMGREVRMRSFEEDGTANASVAVSNGQGGASAVAVNEERALVAWSGSGSGDKEGVYGQRYEVEIEPNVAPVMNPIADSATEVGQLIEIAVTATDGNQGDILTFTLDPANSPAGATIEQTGNNTAIIRWTPDDSAEGLAHTFRVVVTDNDNTPLSDSKTFEVAVGDLPVAIDLNGTAESGNNSEANFVAGGGEVVVTDPALAIRFAEGGTIIGAVIQLLNPPDGELESLSIDTLDTDITATYDDENFTLTLTGADTATNYERVLRTLKYDNSSPDAIGDRTIQIGVTDSGGPSAVSILTIHTAAPDLVAFAKALADAGVKFYGAGWCPFCTEQKELFEDGGQYLPFIEVTNPDRTLNQVGIDNNITSFPTWDFPDGTRLEGVQSLQTLAEEAGIAIPLSDTPYLVELPNDILLVGSPLHVPLDGYDPNGGTLTYTVISDNPDVAATILQGNRSARIKVAGYGDMVFELFEDRASRATDRMIELAEDDFYEDIIFHRVINGFMIQGGDPTGTGSGGSTLGDFDDQYHPDLQHNRRGILSMAKSTDDTNDSQFFITEGATRSLDFNHTIFGLLVEGEGNREAISNTAVSGPVNNPAPVIPVVMEGIEIFEDIENAVLMLKAADGATGTANITVTVTDETGKTFERTFQVTLANDPTNNTPYLADIPEITADVNTVAQVQLEGIDVEGDPVFYFVNKVTPGDYTVTVDSDGLVEVTPEEDFVGVIDIIVGVGQSSITPTDTQVVRVEFA